MVKHLLFLALSLNGFLASAQIDPTSAILLRGGSQAPDKTQLDRGRYTIRPGDNRTSTPVPAPVNKLPAKIEPKRPAAASESKSTSPSAPDMKIDVVETPKTADGAPGSNVEKNVTVQVRDAVLGGSPEEMAHYLGKVHEEDPRQNLLDLSVAPMFFYSDSSSNYWYRSYSTGGPGFQLGARIWASPFFAISASFANSLESSIYSQPGSRDRVAIDFSWFEAGLKWRNYFGVSRHSNYVTLGVDFSETKTNVPPNATDRIRTKTSGVKLSLEIGIPRDPEFAWQFGGWITPRAEHSEGATAISVKSGTKDETTVVGISVGGLHTMSRRSQIFWNFAHSVERTLFKGAANTADPNTGSSPSGVSVTTGTSIFSLGYRWGN